MCIRRFVRDVAGNGDDDDNDSDGHGERAHGRACESNVVNAACPSFRRQR